VGAPVVHPRALLVSSMRLARHPSLGAFLRCHTRLHDSQRHQFRRLDSPRSHRQICLPVLRARRIAAAGPEGLASRGCAPRALCL